MADGKDSSYGHSISLNIRTKDCSVALVDCLGTYKPTMNATEVNSSRVYQDDKENLNCQVKECYVKLYDCMNDNRTLDQTMLGLKQIASPGKPNVYLSTWNIWVERGYRFFITLFTCATPGTPASIYL